ncbi:MAG TPA: tagaturonate reductase [Cyclobacteriaceae bacterium]
MPGKLNRQTVSIQKRPVKIIQFGAGNFLRGFCDWMVDILNEKTSFNGNVAIVQPIRRGMGSEIDKQDGLFHVVLKNQEVDENRLITCVDSVINPFEEPERFLSLAENPDLEFIFSNTTEAGITFNANDNDTFPGRATALLYHRFKTLPSKRLTFLPSELIENNGAALKAVVRQYADHWKLPVEFTSWIDDKVVFCNTLVDRIVTGYQDISSRTGYDDKFTVMAEPYHLWVIEAPAHVRKALPLDDAPLNVLFVDDLTPYRTRKVRILNGAHTTLVPVAYLKGLRTVRESVEDAEVGNYLLKAIYEEIIPTLDLPKEELTTFADDVMDRFRNPFIKHELANIALNSVSKYKVRVLPSVLKYIELRKQLPKRLLYSLAALIKLYKTNINDTPEVTKFFKQAWDGNDAVFAAKSILGNKAFWGQDLNEIPGLNKLVTEDLKVLEV